MAAQTVWIGTRKGAFELHSDERRAQWQLIGPQFLGHVIHHIVEDPRDPQSVLIAAKTGHLGPTVFRSRDRGKSWKEAAQPPAFRQALQNEKPRAVDRVFWLTPGHVTEPGVWYAGTSPCGLFRSEDGGEHWQPVPGLTIIRCTRNGLAMEKAAHRMALCCTRSSSIRGIRLTCI